MFYGTYEINLLDKHRIALPSKIRQELGDERIVLTSGFESCVAGYPEKIWRKTADLELTKPVSDHNARDLRRQMFARAEVVSLDQQGRFVVSENLLRFTGFDKILVVIGAGDHFEIWDKNNWQKYSSGLDK